MSAIFISHSSKDNEFCQKLIKWLDEQGHRSVFLDFDESSGIAAGQDWEQKLYKELRVCSAMIVVCTEDLMNSKWCFAEITHARSLGKQIFPIQIAPCDINSILSNAQVIDFINLEEKVAFERLKQGLVKAGIDVKDPFTWDGSRPPYPGLLAFQEEDAAIFFGRGKEIREGLDVLTSTHRYEGSGLIMVLGASGSGKSSLVRAGIIPKLRRDPERWLVLNPIQPGEDPFRELAKALKKAFQNLSSEEYSIDELYGQLQSDFKLAKNSSNDLDSNPQFKNYDLFEKLHEEADRKNTNIIFIIDQFEELLDRPEEHLGSQFLYFLKSILQKEGSKLIVLGTIRSDFLGMFQQNPALLGLEFGKILVGPVNTESLTEIIIKPAELSGVGIEPKLVQGLIEDTRTNDALPLLAFTLRELYDNYSKDNLLEFREYEELGGIEGSVAKSAEGVLSKPKLTTSQEELLRKAFLQMTRVNEQGNFTRNRVAWTDINPEIHEVLNRLVNGRLLVSSTYGDDIRTLEVAHESLFRSWKRLKAWLDEDREFLLWRKRLINNLVEWENNNQSKSVLLTGVKLQEASSWMKSQKEQLNTQERLFIEESVKEAVRQKRIKQKRNGVLISIGTILLISIFILFLNAEKEKTKAQANYLISEANRLVETDATLALHLATIAHSLQPNDSVISKDAYSIYSNHRFYKTVVNYPSQILYADLSPDGTIIGILSYDDSLSFWNLEGNAIGNKISIKTDNSLSYPASFTFFPDSNKIIIFTRRDGKEGYFGQISNLEGIPVGKIMHLQTSGFLVDTDFNQSIDTIKFQFSSGKTSFWNLNGDFIHEIEEDSLSKSLGYFSKNGQIEIETSDDYKSILVFNQEGLAIQDPIEFPNEIRDIDYSPERELLLVSSSDNTISLNNLNGRKIGNSIYNGKLSDNFFTPPFFTNKGKSAILFYLNTAWYWDLDIKPKEDIILEHSDYISSANFSPDGKFVIIASGNTVHIRDLNGNSIGKPLIHKEDVISSEFSPSGKIILTASEDGTARLWNIGGSQIGKTINHSDHLEFAAFSKDGKKVLTSSDLDFGLEGNFFGLEGNLFDLEGNPINDTINIFNFIINYEEENSFGSIANQKLFDTSKEGAKFVGAYEDLIVVVDSEGNKLGEMGHGDAVSSVVFSPNDSIILSASYDNTAQLWDLNGKRLGKTMVHPIEVLSASFSSDGNRILTFDSYGTIRVWDKNGNPMVTVMEYAADNGLISAKISPDGNFVLTTYENGQARITEVELIDEFIKRDHIAPLTQEQKEKYGIEEESWISSLINRIFSN